MKTGTITFHAPNNNGPFLQAYALQNILMDECHVENEIIDFYSEQQARQYSVFRKPYSVGDVGRNLISVAHYARLSRRHQRFDAMRKQHLILSRRCTTEIGLNNRTASINDDSTEMIQKPIDYSKINEKLDTIRKNGIGYLKTVLFQ